MTPADWIGRSHERMGARDRVTGALRYTADLSFDDVLHVKLVQVGGARSTIKQIDRSEALKVPGVECVLIADDLPKPIPRFGRGVVPVAMGFPGKRSRRCRRARAVLVRSASRNRLGALSSIIAI